MKTDNCLCLVSGKTLVLALNGSGTALANVSQKKVYDLFVTHKIIAANLAFQ